MSRILWFLFWVFKYSFVIRHLTIWVHRVYLKWLFSRADNFYRKLTFILNTLTKKSFTWFLCIYILSKKPLGIYSLVKKNQTIPSNGLAGCMWKWWGKKFINVNKMHQLKNNSLKWLSMYSTRSFCKIIFWLKPLLVALTGSMRIKVGPKTNAIFCKCIRFCCDNSITFSKCLHR